MKTLMTVLIAGLLSISSTATMAEMISATGATLDDAQAHIAAKAKQLGASSYKIVGAQNNNRVYMTAEIEK